MPFVRVEVIAGRTPAEKRALLDVVHGGRPASEVELGFDVHV